MAPARESFRAAVASAAGTKSRRIFDPAVVRMPRVQMIVFQRDRNSEQRVTVFSVPATAREFFFRAARGGQRVLRGDVRNALSAGLWRSMRRRNISVNSTGESFALCQQRGKVFDRGKREGIDLLHRHAFILERFFPPAADFQTFRCSQ